MFYVSTTLNVFFSNVVGGETYSIALGIQVSVHWLQLLGMLALGRQRLFVFGYVQLLDIQR